MRQLQKTQKTSAFTLIELLCVVSIILVLAALVSAVTQSAIKKTRDVSSLNNLSQLSKALILYNSENGRYPYSVDNSAGFSDFWVEAVKPYLGNQTNSFQSPNEKHHNGLSDYGANNLVVNPARTGVAGTPAGQRIVASIQRQSGVVLLSDARDTSGSALGGSWMVDGQQWIQNGQGMGSPFSAWPPRNSGGKVQAAFVDGHVESVTGERWTSERQSFFDPDSNN